MAKGADRLDYILREIDRRETVVKKLTTSIRSAELKLTDLGQDMIDKFREERDELVEDIRELREQLQDRYGSE